jgi:hypothetical protein
MRIPSTVERVPRHTSAEINERIRRQTECRIDHLGRAGSAAIDRRLSELDDEWDIERALEANAASVALIGCGLGAFVDRRFFAVPALVAGFLLQHAIQGWCPPVPVFRRLGFRTQPEIEQERYALKALRGDFRRVSADGETDFPRATAAIAAASG